MQFHQCSLFVDLLLNLNTLESMSSQKENHQGTFILIWASSLTRKLSSSC